jgi:hypothetical protein
MENTNTTNCSTSCTQPDAFFNHCRSAIETYGNVSVRCDEVCPTAAAQACRRLKEAGLTVTQEFYGDAIFLQISDVRPDKVYFRNETEAVGCVVPDVAPESKRETQ